MSLQGRTPKSVKRKKKKMSYMDDYRRNVNKQLSSGLREASGSNSMPRAASFESAYSANDAASVDVNQPGNEICSDSLSSNPTGAPTGAPVGRHTFSSLNEFDDISAETSARKRLTLDAVPQVVDVLSRSSPSPSSRNFTPIPVVRTGRAAQISPESSPDSLRPEPSSAAVKKKKSMFPSLYKTISGPRTMARRRKELAKESMEKRRIKRQKDLEALREKIDEEELFSWRQIRLSSHELGVAFDMNHGHVQASYQALYDAEIRRHNAATCIQKNYTIFKTIRKNEQWGILMEILQKEQAEREQKALEMQEKRERHKQTVMRDNKRAAARAATKAGCWDKDAINKNKQNWNKRETAIIIALHFAHGRPRTEDTWNLYLAELPRKKRVELHKKIQQMETSGDITNFDLLSELGEEMSRRLMALHS